MTLHRINWKTVSAGITALLVGLSAAPYELGDVATIIPPEWKARLFTLSIISTFLLRVWKGGTDQKPTTSVEPTPEPEKQ